jgi:signal transduction histidine kinase
MTGGRVKAEQPVNAQTPAARLPTNDEEFISRISHDLRTPLAAIKAAIGVVLANEPPGTAEPLRRMFRNIDRAADQMNSMISNITESARLHQGAAAMRIDHTDLSELTLRVAKSAEPVARRQGQTVETRVPRSAIIALVDYQRIERALLNLIENACKHAPGGATIQLSLDDEGAEYVFSVADEGPGIPEESRNEVFTGAEPGSTGSGRTGLGLPVALRIAQLHGGRIWVEPNVQGGAVFRIALPADK